MSQTKTNRMLFVSSPTEHRIVHLPLEIMNIPDYASVYEFLRYDSNNGDELEGYEIIDLVQRVSKNGEKFPCIFERTSGYYGLTDGDILEIIDLLNRC